MKGTTVSASSIGRSEVESLAVEHATPEYRQAISAERTLVNTRTLTVAPTPVGKPTSGKTKPKSVAEELVTDNAGNSISTNSAQTTDGAGGSGMSGALATLAKQIPAEGLAVYISLYAIVPLLGTFDKAHVLGWVIGFSCVLIAVAINIFALAWAAYAHAGRLTAGGRALLRGRIAGQSIWLSILLVITITATAGNPFAVFLGFSTAYGGGAAVVAAAIIAIMANSPAKKKSV
jgi:hypothetical protein